MRVLALTNMYPTHREPWFGAFVAEQIESLRAAGLAVDVLSFDGRQHATAYARAAHTLRGCIRSGDFDLVHAHYGLTGAVALAQRPLPVVTTFWGSDTGYIAWQRRVGRFVARRTTPIFVSQAIERSLGVSGMVIPSGVAMELFRIEPRVEAQAMLGWTPGTYALFPGSAANCRKRPDLFTGAVEEAAGQFPRLRPVYLEGLSREEVVHAMNAASVLVMTSDWEGSPLAVKEALACGTPVVSVDVGDVSETIGGLPGCAIVPRSPARLGEAIVAALDARVPREVLRERASQFSLDVVAEAVIKVYAGVVR
jgi:teichuronic acid biosynthesis glycosyltransferase TuaC